MVTMTKEIAESYKVIGKKVKILPFKGEGRSLEKDSMEEYIGKVGKIVIKTTGGIGGDSNFGKFEVIFDDGLTWYFLGDLLEIKSKKLLSKISETPKESEDKIKVGDLVRGTPENKYGLTNRDCIMRVEGVDGDSVDVKMLVSKGYVSSNIFRGLELRLFAKITEDDKKEFRLGDEGLPKGEVFKVGDIVIGNGTRYTRTTDRAIMEITSVLCQSVVVKILFHSDNKSAIGETYTISKYVLKKLKKGVAFTSLTE